MSVRGFRKIPVKDEALNRVQSATEEAIRRLDLRVDDAIAPEPRQLFDAVSAAGVYHTAKYAGRITIPAGLATATIYNDAFKASGDARAFARATDGTLTRFGVRVAAAGGAITITGNAAATADLEFFWEYVP